MPRYKKDKLGHFNVHKTALPHIIIKWLKIKSDRDYECIKEKLITYMGLALDSVVDFSVECSQSRMLWKNSLNPVTCILNK